MPRYAMTTFLNPKEIEKVEKARKRIEEETGEKPSKYKLLRDAVLTYCDGCLEGEKEDVGTPEESRGTPRENSEPDSTEDSL